MDTHGNRQRRKALNEALAAGRGATIPGTGVMHGHRSSGGKRNASGVLSSGNQEWSRRGRKDEDDLRGLNNKARRQNISEQVADLLEHVVDDDGHWDDLDDNLWDAALEDLPEGVTFNGNEYRGWWNEDE